MPADDGSKSQDSADKGTSDGHGHLTKAIAAVFATVVAPVLVALGMKFSDVIVASFQPKPTEVAKADPEKPAERKADSPKSDPAKTDVSKVDSTTTASAEKTADSKSDSTPFAEHKGQFAERGKKKKRNLAIDQPTAVEAQASAGFKSLFTGRDLSGWSGTDLKPWSVDAKSNTLVGSAVSGKKPGNWLFSDKDFSDFQLRLEFRMEAGTESGIALRTPPVFNVKDGRMAIRLTSVDKDPIPSGTFVTWSGGSAHPQANRVAAAVLRPGKAWNQIEIEFRGPHLKVTFNGQTIQDVRVDELSGKSKASAGLLQKTGRIALECRSGHVEFRRIEIQELDPAGGK